MAITDISISEELMTNAPSIKYRGNEGPKSPQEMQMMMVDDVLDEAYEQYIYDLLENRPDATPMSKDEFKRMVIGEGMMGKKGPVLPSDEDPINPFGPKPIGPPLPDRKMAAYGGIMGVDGRRQYGIGSFFQKAKDKLFDDLIPNEIKDNPLLTAAVIAGGDQLLTGGAGRSALFEKLGDFKDYVADSKVGKGVTEFLGKSTNAKDPKSKTYGEAILGSIGKNIVPIVGGLTAGLFTKNQPKDQTGMPSDNTALQLADLAKSANLLTQEQGLASGLNFLPSVAARKFTPEEMAITYAQQAANGGRIGYAGGGGKTQLELPFGEPDYYIGKGKNKVGIYKQKDGKLYAVPVGPGGLPDYATGGRVGFSEGGKDYSNDPNYKGWVKTYEMNPDAAEMNENHATYLNFYNRNKNNKAEGGIMDLGGLEKDYRAEGGFVPIGKKEKADDVPARLSVNEFVFTADAVRNAGGGDVDEGAKVMERVMKHLEGGGQMSRESQGMGGAREMFEVSERLSEVV